MSPLGYVNAILKLPSGTFVAFGIGYIICGGAGIGNSGHGEGIV
jgi:hypothetical protein